MTTDRKSTTWPNREKSPNCEPFSDSRHDEVWRRLFRDSELAAGELRAFLSEPVIDAESLETLRARSAAVYDRHARHTPYHHRIAQFYRWIEPWLVTTFGTAYASWAIARIIGTGN